MKFAGSETLGLKLEKSILERETPKGVPRKLAVDRTPLLRIKSKSDVRKVLGSAGDLRWSDTGWI